VSGSFTVKAHRDGRPGRADPGPALRRGPGLTVRSVRWSTCRSATVVARSACTGTVWC